MSLSTKSLLKFKTSRSLGLNFWPNRSITLKQKSVLNQLKKKKLSTYGKEILMRKILSCHYGNLSFNQLKDNWKRASRMKGKTGENFLFSLEQRLETVIYRMNLCRTFREGRQLIAHGFFCVNHHSVDRPSARLQAGDMVSFHQVNQTSLDAKKYAALHARIAQNWKDHACTRTKALHLEVNYTNLSCVFLYAPQQLIYSCEFEIPQWKH